MARRLTRQIVLLRGINLGSTRRVAMPALRAALDEAGFEDVRTYLQSGNVVLSSPLGAQRLARACEERIADAFGFDVDVVVRTRDELARVIDANPLQDAVADPKRYQVTFLSKALPAARVRALAELAAPTEQVVARGRELYAWHPSGVARSRLWGAIAGKSLGVVATSRNWTTVLALLALADAP
jgi:uncharacterized protein (DUF1697 family)